CSAWDGSLSIHLF
nr:immunoglobulin light chain junction region [Macaca mulatta]MPO06052.1 immunoglobulin light chain junction region [Macaca mulatta]MPO08242.1 immunoglobulin light chain junction region [Macaca mulatta]MPO13349.1 immunoglobulin light chain junction region [Macaca mulatta]